MTNLSHHHPHHLWAAPGAMEGSHAELEASFHPQRRKAALVLLSVTLVWGATFIWMKQALNALEVEIETFGTFSVVAYLVALRFLIAMVLVAVFFPKAQAGLKSLQVWRGGAILGGLMLVGFVSQMIALNEINPSTSAFLTSLYVVMTALLTLRMSEHPPRRTLYWGVFMATLGAGFIEGPPHLTWGWGEVMTVACALFFALHIIYTQKLTTALDPLEITLSSFIVVGVGSLCLAVLSSNQAPGMMLDVVQREGVLLPVVLLGFGGSFFCLVALNLFQRHMHPVQAAIIYAFEPVWATIFALGLGLVSWTWWIPFGGCVLLVGNILVEVTSPSEAPHTMSQSVE